MRSLQQRLGTGLVASLIAVFVLQWLAVSYTVRQLSEASMLRNMQHDIETLLAGLTIDATRRLRLDATRVEQVYHTPFSGSYYRIQSGTSVQRSRSLWDQDLPGTSLSPGGAEQQRVPGPQAQLLLMLTRSYLLQGQPVSISVADDLTPLEQERFYGDAIANPKSPHRYYAVRQHSTHQGKFYADASPPPIEHYREFVALISLENLSWENGHAEIGLIVDPARKGQGMKMKDLQKVCKLFKLLTRPCSSGG